MYTSPRLLVWVSKKRREGDVTGWVGGGGDRQLSVLLSQSVCSHLFHSFLPWRPLLLKRVEDFKCMHFKAKIFLRSDNNFVGKFVKMKISINFKINTKSFKVNVYKNKDKIFYFLPECHCVTCNKMFALVYMSVAVFASQSWKGGGWWEQCG